MITITLLGTALLCAITGRALSGIFSQKHWQPWENHVTTLSFVLLAAIADAAFTETTTRGNTTISALYVLLAVLFAYSRALDDLEGYLQRTVAVFGVGKLSAAETPTPTTTKITSAAGSVTSYAVAQSQDPARPSTPAPQPPRGGLILSPRLSSYATVPLPAAPTEESPAQSS